MTKLESKRQELCSQFTREMEQYGVRAEVSCSVSKAFYGGMYFVCLRTRAIPVEGHGAALKQLKADGYTIERKLWRGPLASRFMFTVEKSVRLVLINPDEEVSE